MYLLRLAGEINVACSAEMKKLLLEGLAAEPELQVDLEHASELDVTVLQLLWAAARAAHASGRRFTVQGRVAGEIAASARDAGFDNFPDFYTSPVAEKTASN